MGMRARFAAWKNRAIAYANAYLEIDPTAIVLAYDGFNFTMGALDQFTDSGPGSHHFVAVPSHVPVFEAAGADYDLVRFEGSSAFDTARSTATAATIINGSGFDIIDVSRANYGFSAAFGRPFTDSNDRFRIFYDSSFGQVRATAYVDLNPSGYQGVPLYIRYGESLAYGPDVLRMWWDGAHLYFLSCWIGHIARATLTSPTTVTSGYLQRGDVTGNDFRGVAGEGIYRAGARTPDQARRTLKLALNRAGTFWPGKGNATLYLPMWDKQGTWGGAITDWHCAVNFHEFTAGTTAPKIQNLAYLAGQQLAIDSITSPGAYVESTVPLSQFISSTAFHFYLCATRSTIGGEFSYVFGGSDVLRLGVEDNLWTLTVTDSGGTPRYATATQAGSSSSDLLVIEGIYCDGLLRLRIWQQGQSLVSGTPVSIASIQTGTSTDYLWIGNVASHGVDAYSGRICSLVIYDRDMTSNEQVETSYVYADLCGLSFLAPPIVPATWQPSDEASLTLHLEPDGVTASGSDITALLDASATAATFTASSGQEPQIEVINSFDCVDFTGSPRKMTTSTALSAIAAASAYTVSFAFKCNIATSTITAGYATDCILSDNGGYFWVGIRDDGSGPQLVVGHYSSTEVQAYSSTLTANQLYTVTVVYNGTQVELFVNGASVDTDAGAGISSRAGALTLGKSTFSSSFFNGTLCELFVYNVAKDSTYVSNADAYLADKYGVP
jgi:hypothetical protein